MMEMEPIEECRTLLQKNTSSRWKRLDRRMFEAITTDGLVFLIIIVGLFLGLSVFLCIHFITNYSTFENVIGPAVDVVPNEKGNLQADIEFEAQMKKKGEDSLVVELTAIESSKASSEEKLFLESWNKGKQRIEELKKMSVLLEKSKLAEEDSFSSFHSQMEEPETSGELEKCALIAEYVKRQSKQCISADLLPEDCKPSSSLKCDPKYPYRSYDGSCNNLANAEWGMGGTAFRRFLQAEYSDDVSQPRLSIYGVELPMVRVLSEKLYSHRRLTDANTTLLFAFYGLFLDHDLVFTGQTLGKRNGCCGAEVQQNPHLKDTSCWEVRMLPTDPFYGPHNVTCMTYYRSRSAIGKCPGRREQMNVWSAYVDGSQIYGPFAKHANILRSFKNGMHRTSLVGNTPLLPINQSSADICYTNRDRYKCFMSGDIRTNMQLQLMTMHTLWFREHNRIAEALQRINPHWNDETLYQEARRIVIAEMQHITYNEFLPILFGPEKMKLYKLDINPRSYYDGYDETIDAGIYNGFASAAFRFGHSLIQDHVDLVGPEYKIRSHMPLHETYANPAPLYKRGFDDIIRGVVMQQSRQVDSCVTEEIRGRLFQKRFKNVGFDLSAISIQRGRDHGLPPYVKWREFCELPVVKTWDDLYKYMDKNHTDTLREMYMSVEDIDLIPGGLSEKKVEGSILGPTYLCIIGKQFHNLRYGDRFWFENPNQAGSFTEAQLQEIYKSSLSGILCDNSDNLKSIQKFPFLVSTSQNPTFQCKDIPRIDFTPWEQ